MSRLLTLALMTMGMTTIAAGFGGEQPVGPNNPGIREPVLSRLTGRTVRIPNTDQAEGDTLLNLVGEVRTQDARGAMSLTGHAIGSTRSPNRAMRDALDVLSRSARDQDQTAMHAAADDLMAILTGTTQGEIFDGFSMLNYNRGAYVPDHMPGEYKMKTVRDSGEEAPGIDGEPRRIWEVDAALLYYDGQIDSDTFMLRVPVEAHPFDTLRVHYRIYALDREDFSPTAVLLDQRAEGSVQFPFKGFDSVWVPLDTRSVTELTVDYPPLSLLRGIYTWGWRIHPPRIQFMQPVFEIVNAHTGAVELDSQGLSFAFRNRGLSIADIADAAPEKKMYVVARAALEGADPGEIYRMLNEPDVGPRGTWQDWSDMAEDQRQLPPEAWDTLATEGIQRGSFGPYRFVSVYMNNEMYGEGPEGSRIEGWFQGDRFPVKLINFDKHTHYFRNVDFGPKLFDDLGGFSSGSHSFGIMNFKPTYGAPKVAEVQWRALWGFRPHWDMIHQDGVQPRPADLIGSKMFLDGHGVSHVGYQYSTGARGGDFRFNPPPFIIGSVEHPSPQRLRESDGSDGLLIGQLTEGYGVAKMCDADEHPLGGFCEEDLSEHHPLGLKNVDTDDDGTPDVLWFPPFIRNPNPDEGGDVIPPTPAWTPFLWISPHNGTLFIDPDDPSLGYWADLTYAHGRPIPPGGDLSAMIEAPRSAGQVFYQFDDLFHDNAIFSPHPTFSPFLTSNQALASAMRVTRGVLTGGGVRDLDSSDDHSVGVQARRPTEIAAASIEIEVTGTVSTESPAALRVLVEAESSGNPARQVIDLFNYEQGVWERLDERDAFDTDSVVVVSVTENPERFVEPGSRAVKVRVGYIDHGVTFPAWGGQFDQVFWTVVEQ